MVVTPGADLMSNSILEKGPLFANEASLAAIDPAHYPMPGPASDFQGQTIFPALIPGASYIFRDFTTVRDPGEPGRPQGIHRQARRDARPGRHPDREATRMRLAPVKTRGSRSRG